MITGLGVDIVEIERMVALYARYGERLLRRVLTDRERLRAKSGPVGTARYVARQFAAKEAVAKALGTGFRGLGLKDIEVLRDERGKPVVGWPNGVPGARGREPRMLVSIADERHYAVAFAVLEE